MDDKLSKALKLYRAHVDIRAPIVQDILKFIEDSEEFDNSAESWSKARAMVLVSLIVCERYIETGEGVSKKWIHEVSKFHLGYISKVCHGLIDIGLLEAKYIGRPLYLWPSLSLIQLFRKLEP